MFITLAKIGALELLEGTAGEVDVPGAVAEEVTEDPAESVLADGVDDGWIRVEHVDAVEDPHLDLATTHLGVDEPSDGVAGDVALLALAMATEECVVVTDDKPLREVCKALSIPLSGSIGILIRAVERGDLRADEAKARLLATDEVGMRLSARLFRNAERQIEKTE